MCLSEENWKFTDVLREGSSFWNFVLRSVAGIKMEKAFVPRAMAVQFLSFSVIDFILMQFSYNS